MALQTGTPEIPKFNRPTTLPEGTTIERRADGSVWQRTVAIPAHDKDGKVKDGPDFLEFRVDSVKDQDYITKGGTPWYYKFLNEKIPGRKAETSSDPVVAQIIADLTARVEAAEAAIATSDNEVEVVITDQTTPAKTPSPQLTNLIKKGAGKGKGAK